MTKYEEKPAISRQSGDEREERTMNPQSDRDLLIRVDADLKNLDVRVKDFGVIQHGQNARTETLAQSLQQLTYNVGALVKSMEKAEAGLHSISQHDGRLAELEKDMNTLKTRDEVRNGDVAEIKQQFGRALWLGKIAYGILTTPVLLFVVWRVVDFFKSGGF